MTKLTSFADKDYWGQITENWDREFFDEPEPELELRRILDEPGWPPGQPRQLELYLTVLVANVLVLFVVGFGHRQLMDYRVWGVAVFFAFGIAVQMYDLAGGSISRALLVITFPCLFVPYLFLVNESLFTPLATVVYPWVVALVLTLGNAQLRYWVHYLTSSCYLPIERARAWRVAVEKWSPPPPPEKQLTKEQKSAFARAAAAIVNQRRWTWIVWFWIGLLPAVVSLSLWANGVSVELTGLVTAGTIVVAAIGLSAKYRFDLDYVDKVMDVWLGYGRNLKPDDRFFFRGPYLYSTRAASCLLVLMLFTMVLQPMVAFWPIPVALTGDKLMEIEFIEADPPRPSNPLLWVAKSLIARGELGLVGWIFTMFLLWLTAPIIVFMLVIIAPISPVVSALSPVLGD